MGENNDIRRPPLGVMPKALWYESRIKELSRAINEYAKHGDFDAIYLWSCELTELLRMRENHIAKQAT